MLSINFNNFNSYEDLGLTMIKTYDIPIFKKKIEFVEIEGRNGVLTIDTNSYEDSQISLSFNAKYDSDFNENITKIKGLLNNIEDNKLYFSDNLDGFYFVKNVDYPSNLQRVLKKGLAFSLNFNIAPFFYLNQGQKTITITNKTSTLYNPGTIYSEPYLKIFGFGNIQLTINDTTFTISNVNEYVEIDCELFVCNKASENKGNDMVGNYPKLKTGVNNISWSGNISKIDIIPKWRCI